MKKKATLLIFFICAVIIGGCTGQVQGNTSQTSTPEPLIITVSGYSLDELGFTASLPVLDWLTDPNHKNGTNPCKLAVYHSESVQYANGKYTSIDLEIADSKLAYNNISLKFLQGYKVSELTGEKKAIRIGEDYLPLDEVEKYVIKRSGDIIICDFTERFYSTPFGGFDGYLEHLQAENPEYDYSWIGDVYDYFSGNVGELISAI